MEELLGKHPDCYSRATVPLKGPGLLYTPSPFVPDFIENLSHSWAAVDTKELKIIKNSQMGDW